MSIADKLITIADNTPAVAEAVNASKATINGTFIHVDDVMNIEHPLEIRASEDTTVKVYGKNLFNKYSAQYSGAFCTSAIVNNELVITTKNGKDYNSANFVIPNGDLLVGKTITISGEWETSGDNTGCLRLGWTSTAGINNMVGTVGATSTSGKSVTKTIGTKPDNADQLCLWLYGNYTGSCAKGDTVTYKNVQFEISPSATEYQAYTEQTATVDSADNVTILKSVAPAMTIVADGEAVVTYFPTSAAATHEKYQQLVQAENDLKEIL